MEYAVIKTGGKQYKISTGDILDVEKLPLKPKDEYPIKDVLLYVNDGVCKIGTPLVPDILVKVKVLENVKKDKIRIAKFKSKVRYRRVAGHRQTATRLMVQSIMNSSSLKKSAAKKKA